MTPASGSGPVSGRRLGRRTARLVDLLGGSCGRPARVIGRALRRPSRRPGEMSLTINRDTLNFAFQVKSTCDDNATDIFPVDWGHTGRVMRSGPAQTTARPSARARTPRVAHPA